MHSIYILLFPVVWLAFIVYWLLAAFTAKKNRITQTPFQRGFHLLLTVLAVWLIAGHRFQTPVLTWQILPENQITFFTGAALLLAGLGFAVWARVHLGKYWSAVVSLKEDHHLIQTGPYRWIRHPIYTGILTGVAGTAIALGQMRGFIALLALTIIYWLKSRREERLLMTQFSDEYVQYRKQAGALLPFPPLPQWMFGLAAVAVAALFASMLIRHEDDLAKSGLSKYEYYAQVSDLEQQTFALERAGKRNTAAHQILAETRWLLDCTRDWDRIADHITALRAALADPAMLGVKDEQLPGNGSWGKWYTEWFFKLDDSYDHIADLDDEGKVPQYPVRFLNRYNSPVALTGHLRELLVSDVERDGVDHRREFNETVADLTRMILRHKPANYPFDPGLKPALMNFLMNEARDPQTGYWGEQYRTADGGIRKTKDLSITFHIVSYLHGEVPDWPKIIDTTLAIKDEEYPLGWQEWDGYLNHNNMDVVELFRLGWPHATPEQQAAMRVEIKKMLDWCLNKSLQPDGTFKVSRHDDSVETSVYFGTSFLVRLGYFDAGKRFWTDEQFPEAAGMKEKIVKYIRANYDSGGENGTYYRSTLEQLGAKL